MKIEIFTTPTCTYCKKTKEYFKENKIRFTEHDLTKESNMARKMIEMTGQQGVPVIVVNNDWDEAIIGFDKRAIEKAINKSS